MPRKLTLLRRSDTIVAEIRAIYRLLDQEIAHTAATLDGSHAKQQRLKALRVLLAVPNATVILHQP